MPGQERGVEIETAEGWQFQDGLRENLTIGHDHHDIRLQAPQHFEGCRIAEFRRLVHGNTAFNGQLFDRRGAWLQVTTGGFVGLGDDARHFVFSRVEEGFQGGESDLPGAAKNNAHHF